MKTESHSITGKHLSARFTSGLAVMLVCGGLFSVLQSRAAILSWSGGGANANWDNDANWGFVGTPVSGDSLIFPASQPNQTNTNNIVGLTLSQIRFVGAGGGYNIRGNDFTVTNHIFATNTTGANIISNNITLGPLTQVVTVGSNASLTLAGGLSGTTNGITKAGLGTLTYGDGPANSYSGPTLVMGGILQLAKSSSEAIIAGFFTNSTLVISNAIVRELAPFQIGTLPVTVDGGSALLDLNGFNDAIGNKLVLLNGGKVQTGAGVLSFDSSVPNSILIVSNSSSSISGNMNIGTGTCTMDCSSFLNLQANVSGSANIVKTGANEVDLYGANSYTGLTTVNAGQLWAVNNLALGSTNAGTVVNGNAIFGVFSAHITNESLTINSTNNGGAFRCNSPSDWVGPITLNGDVAIEVNAALGIDGPISGAGGFTKFGANVLTLKGATTNTYGGMTSVDAGTLVLDKIPLDGAIPHDLVINTGTVQALRQNQINNSSTVTIGASGILNLSGNTGNNNVLSSPVHNNNSIGNWTLGYAFTPNANITVTHVRHYFGTRVKFWSNGGSLLATQNVVSVPGTWVETALSAPLQLTAGITYRVGAYTGGTGSNYYWREDIATNFSHGTIGEGYEVAGDAFPTNPDGVHCWFVDFRYTVDGGDGIASLNGSGSVNLGSAYVNSFGTGSHTYGGVISGAGGAFHVSGAGLNYTLNGNNTYSGPTLLFDGSAHTMVINGSQPKSEVYVGDMSLLGGSGTVGNITVNGAIAPGSSPGMLTCSNVLINPSKLFAVELTGPTVGTGYDQLNVRGGCNISNAALGINLAFSNTIPVAIGQQFRIINNDSVDAILGNFAGYGGGATWTQNGYRVVISYVGGTGNDVLLTLTNVPGEVVSSTVSSGNGDGIIAPNECNYFSVAITNRSATPMTGITATLASKTPGVVVAESPVPYPTIAGNSKGTNAAPFQISTSPNFICGSNIVLELTVKTASHGAFIVPVTLATGAPAAPVRFDNNTTVNVPDISTIESTNNVAVWNGGPLTKIAVSLWLSAPIDGDINLTLFAPDGSSVDLSSGNGGAGLHYGTGSADGSRTTFDDGAATSITAGTAPFVGTFRPEASLTNLLGTTPVAGNWRLRVQDTGFSGFPDTLRNWSLFLYGTDCGTGSGLCDLCPNVTFTAVFGPGTPLQTNYTTINGTNSVCGVVKPCPGTDGGGGAFPADNFVFRNGPSDACITVTVTNIDVVGAMAVAAYSAIPDPNNPDRCANYLANPANIVGVGSSQTFSFDVASNAVFVVNALGGSFGSYKVTVTGGDCRPVLHATDIGAGKTKFDWTTAANGYQLESTNALPGATIWPAITNSPMVINSRYTVTNTVPPANQFYHLRKPVP